MNEWSEWMNGWSEWMNAVNEWGEWMNEWGVRIQFHSYTRHWSGSHQLRDLDVFNHAEGSISAHSVGITISTFSFHYLLGSLLPTNLSELFQLFCLVFFPKYEGTERYFLLHFGSGRQSTGLGSSPWSSMPLSGTKSQQKTQTGKFTFYEAGGATRV